MQHFGEVEIDLSWWRERHIFHLFSKRHSGGHGPDISVGAPEKVSEKERTKGHRHVEHGGDAQGDLLPRLGWDEEDEPENYRY